MRFVAVAVIIFALRRSFYDFEIQATKNYKAKGIAMDEDLKKKLIENKDNEANFVGQLIEKSGVSSELLQGVIHKIKRTFENVTKNKDKYNELGVKHIYTLFVNQ